ncbi:Cysteine desulfurase 2, chloroplastic [Apostasia shenzhenica]|uniref:Cysteine desulfurase 2, chloroplastic n=1 Tax=Apostasia shenzhenica TaxID=1088818 RepID=A0A2I0APL9_9ASPA|nr:Cysteine desulfurase 2, chloroplastic [Apostasia shenzhenica]
MASHDLCTLPPERRRAMLPNRSQRGTAMAKEKIAWVRSQLIGEDEEIRTPFGMRRLTYADHTASGRCLSFVENYITKNVLPFYGNTHTNDSFVGEQMTTMVREASQYIKRCLRAGPDEALMFCGSGATAAVKRLQEVMGIAVPANMREKMIPTEEERWVVFVGPTEHHSNLLSWRQTTAEVVEIGVDSRSGMLLDMEALEMELARAKRARRPMLGSFSACSNVTGILTDTRAVARLLHRYGAFVCFDFAASAPYVEIDMRSGDETMYDAVFISPHKFTGGPGAPGILVMSRALYLLKSSPPSTCGGGVVAYVNGFNPEDTLYYDDVEEREDAGTPAIIQKIRAALTFWVKEFVGYPAIEFHEKLYIEAAVQRLLPNSKIKILGDSNAKRLAILSFLVFPHHYLDTNNRSSQEEEEEEEEEEEGHSKPLNGRFVAKLLNDLFGIQARGGCSCAGPYGHYLLGVDETSSCAIRSHIQRGYNGLKPGWTRVSFSYYMTVEEFEFILSAIEFIADHGHLFMPLYDFDWTTGDWNVCLPVLQNSLSIVKKKKKTLMNVLLSPRTRKPSKRFVDYLKNARKIALYKPERRSNSSSIPEGVDPKLIYFLL